MKSNLTSRIPQITGRLQADARIANATSARRIAAAARSAAPRDTGALADSIKAVPGATPDQERVVVTDWKAHFIEFGTVRRGAQPFLVPAAEAERAAHLAAVREVFR